MKQRTTVLRPLGLITQPNKHGQFPDGAMSVAQNVVMRSPGIVEPIKTGTRLIPTTTAAGFSWHRIWWRDPDQDDDYLVYGDASGATQLFAWEADASSPLTLPGYWEAELGAGGAGKHAVATRDRLLIAAEGGVVVTEEGLANAARMAGLPAMQQFTVTASGTTGWLENGRQARYRLVVRRKQSDGYLIQSPPSYALLAQNNHASNDYDVTITASWADDDDAFPFLEGDVLEAYRTPSQATGTDPGDTYYLASSHELTGAEILARSASFTDMTSDDGLGLELYTNPGQQGASQANYPPASASGMASFKGYTFYITPETAKKFEFRIEMVSGSNIANGIGTRNVIADTTNMNATLTNVSPGTAGIVAGQRITGTGIPANTTVVSTTATTIVMSAQATATAAGVAVSTVDVIEVGGDSHSIGTIGELITSIRSNTNNSYAWSLILDESPTAALSGVASAGTLDVGVSIAFLRPYYVLDGAGIGDATFRATNGANYQPPLPNLADTAKTAEADTRNNRLTFSKHDQPEAVALVSELLVGNGTIRSVVATKDVLYVFASDGLWRVTGGGPLPSDWQVDPVDTKLTIANPLAADVLGSSVWAYTNRGLVAITYDDVEEVSRGIIGDLLPGVSTTASDAATFLVCDPVNAEVRLTFSSGSASTTYIFNTLTKAFTTQTGSDVDSASARILTEAYTSALGIVWTVEHDSGDAEVYKAGSTYRADTEVRFQPITGDGSAFSLKQWGEYEHLFRSADASLTLDGTVNGTTTSTGIVGTVKDGEMRFVSAPGLDDAMAPHIALGFLPQTADALGWQWIGTSARWSYLSPQVQR